ncbi:hypothetical protein GCM10007916_00450 [Psychromonas marina]|uniref:WYL domain-containing protein n=1 Tax=Psychromonas marina TaxID=88364 RepID=A0ABQ6DV73_9GAMM|nr:WYL domain-containing protein [Psychromonas marina]GLS88978.1 hypothetical protein GCM10007916_00450 [Psychromonas marina]
MNKTLRRIENILASIPCYPDAISIRDIKDVLAQKSLLNENTDDSSQMKMVRRLVKEVCEEYCSIEEISDKHPKHYRIAEKHPHPSRTDVINKGLPLEVIKPHIIEMLPYTLRGDAEHIFNAVGAPKNKNIKLWKKSFHYVQHEFQLQAPAYNKKHFQLIEQALLDKKNICMQYKTREQILSTYHITPLGIILRFPNFYLIANKNVDERNETNEIRTFKLSRIETLVPEFTTINDTSAFNIHEYATQDKYFSGGTEINLVLNIKTENYAHLLHENKFNINQSISEINGEFTEIRATVKHSDSLEKWLFKYAYYIEVIRPLELREKVINYIKKAQNTYRLN